MSNCKLTDDHHFEIAKLARDTMQELATKVAEYTDCNSGSLMSVREAVSKQLVPGFYAAFDAACDTLPGSRG